MPSDLATVLPLPIHPRPAEAWAMLEASLDAMLPTGRIPEADPVETQSTRLATKLKADRNHAF